MRKPIETDEEREAHRARILERYKQMASGITDVLRATLQTIPALDREILEPLLDRWMMAGREALRQGPQGYIDDSRVLGSRWGFSVQDIEASVIVFHGEADPMVPVAAGRWLARQIPDCRAIFYPDEGHHALLRHWKEALLALTE
jgi:pimeloyl-ACP methyl ester carboxylesterase